MSATPSERSAPSPLKSPRPPRRPWIETWGSRLALAVVILAPTVRGDEPYPADALLKLVPAEAGAVLALDNMRDRWRETLESPLGKRISGLSTVRRWLEAEGARDFFQARDRILSLLQTNSAEVHDEILGDAVVLAILLPDDPAQDASHARGLLALKARRPELLQRLIQAVDRHQRQSGEVAAVVESRRGKTPYIIRQFPEGSGRLPETYVLFPDGVFAFSNSESLIHGVIDRKEGNEDRKPSLVESAGFAETTRPLSAHPLARTYLSPEFLARILDGLPQQPSSTVQRFTASARSHLGSLSRISAALAIEDDRVQLHVVQAPQTGASRRGETSLFSSLASSARSNSGPGLTSLPKTAVAAAVFSVDAPGLYTFLADLVPPEDQKKLVKLEAIAGSLLMGRSLRTQILPALGPRMMIYADAPEQNASGFPFPVVASVSIDAQADRPNAAGGAEVSTASAIDNALRAGLTALTLNRKYGATTADVVTQNGVTTLNVPFPFAYAIDPQGRRLSVGTSAASVARGLTAGVHLSAGARFLGFQSAAFSDCESYACLDLAALHALAIEHKDRLVSLAARYQGREAAEVAGELDQLLEVAGLFDAAYLAGRSETPGSLGELRLGLLARAPATQAVTP